MTASGRVVIADAYPHVWGGSHPQTLALLEGLPAEGFETRLVTPGIGILTREAAARGIPTTVVPATGPLARYERQAGLTAALALPGYWHRARRALHGATVVHANDHRGVLMVGAAARAMRIPVVWHVHARSAGHVVDRACAAIASALVVPTAASGSDLATAGRPAHVVPGVVSPPATSWTGAGSHRIVAIGRLFPSKGLHHLIEAVARVRDQLPHVTLDIIGGPSSPESTVARELRTRVSRLGMTSAVRFHGHLEDPWTVARRAGLFVQASTGEETQGLALREALLLGMPVVCTDLPAWADVSDPTLVRVPPADAEALADAITVALRDRRPRRDPAPAEGVRTERDLVRDMVAVYRDLRQT